MPYRRRTMLQHLELIRFVLVQAEAHETFSRALAAAAEKVAH